MTAPTTTPSRPAPQVATPTPGPYLRAGATVYALTETGGWDRNGPVMCNRFTAFVQSGVSCRPGEPEATAQLLAAAPAMVAALKGLLDNPAFQVGAPVMDDARRGTKQAISAALEAWNAAIAAARSALAIAQGAAPAGGEG